MNETTKSFAKYTLIALLTLLPLRASQFRCGQGVHGLIVLHENLVCPSTSPALTVDASNTEIHLNGYNIVCASPNSRTCQDSASRIPATSYGILSQGPKNVHVYGPGQISGFDVGIHIDPDRAGGPIVEYAQQPVTLPYTAQGFKLADIKDNGTLPSANLPQQCKVVPPEQVLECYLKAPSNSLIAHAVSYRFPGGSKSWQDWPDSNKEDLRKAFMATVTWYRGGMVSYPGVVAMDPPMNMWEADVIQGKTRETELDPQTAWTIYTGHVALTLASEIYGWVPWSLSNFDYHSLSTLLDGYGMFLNIYARGATPSNAIYTFKFLKNNNLIGPTRVETIGRVLNWSRQLTHFVGDPDKNPYSQILWSTWRYYGYPPVSRIIEGTVNLLPGWSELGVRHWTEGCSGTSTFLPWVFRAANIPVTDVSEGTAHVHPYFMSEKLYLSHGDDPYNGGAQGGYPAQLMLIDQATWDTWFGDVRANTDNPVGRRIKDLAIEYPGSPRLVADYCKDVKNGSSHANGKVYLEWFQGHGYSVKYLEAGGLWQKLGQMAQCAQ